MNVRFETALICEDIRREERGKLALAGVFAADLVVNRFPAVLSLSFLIVAEVGEAIESEFDIRLQLDDLQLFQGKGKVAPKFGGRVLLPVPKQLVKIERTGILRLDARQANVDWETLTTTPVRSLTAATVPMHKARVPANSSGRPAHKRRLH